MALLSKKLVAFTRAEMELLKYIDSLDVRGANDHVRAAIRLYAKSHPLFDMDAFERHMKKDVMSEMPAHSRDDFEEDLDILRRAMEFSEVSPTFDLDCEVSSRHDLLGEA